VVTRAIASRNWRGLKSRVRQSARAMRSASFPSRSNAAEKVDSTMARFFSRTSAPKLTGWPVKSE
jgi:hypothetical protein